MSLHRALAAAREAIAAGASRADALAAAAAEVEAASVAPEYLEILSADDLAAPRWTPGEEVVVAIAARIGRARLIDNSIARLPVPVSELVPN